jgi:hypothetical protein
MGGSLRDANRVKETSEPMLVLLDKGVVRRYAEGYTRSVRNQPLTAEQRLAHRLLQPSSNVSFFVSRELVNLLLAHVPMSITRQLSPLLRVLVPTKYQRRWARRLQQHFNFGREDAHVLSLATFGTGVSGDILGVDLFVTFDQKCLDRFLTNLPGIEKRFSSMTSHLSPPYVDVELSEVITPAEALEMFCVSE